MTLTNNGDAASAVEPAVLVLPTGVQVTNVDAGAPVPALRRVTAGLLRAGPCLETSDTTCTIDLPSVPAQHKIVVTLALAIDSTVTSGQLTVTVLGESVTLTLTVNSPAALSIDDFAVSQQLYAGGTGQLTARVTNNGQQTSTEQRIDIAGLPEGVTVTGISGDASCEGDQPANALAVGSPTCSLNPVDPTGAGALVIDLDVQPFAPSETETPTTLSIGDVLSPPLPLTALAGIGSLNTAPAGPFTAGQPATITVTPALQGSATNPGPITLTSTDDDVTFGPSEGCTPAAESTVVTCALSPFDLDIVIPVEHQSGTLGDLRRRRRWTLPPERHGRDRRCRTGQPGDHRLHHQPAARRRWQRPTHRNGDQQWGPAVG